MCIELVLKKVVKDEKTYNNYYLKVDGKYIAVKPVWKDDYNALKVLAKDED